MRHVSPFKTHKMLREQAHKIPYAYNLPTYIRAFLDSTRLAWKIPRMCMKITMKKVVCCFTFYHFLKKIALVYFIVVRKKEKGARKKNDHKYHQMSSSYEKKMRWEKEVKYENWNVLTHNFLFE